ncbi:hypothetical protein NGF19_01095 [Streptomyces sp. RY43-2]|uniref:Secreted protein n=1 Tax=Streptomyces macrolidinus TaxID=2952607 RepID=A0ABT0Z6J7_9ACTN|nr:hypothetical protein [Streptomyces macrolidinus]MCN9239392.1 hypothetical protein [Streptomyces macrolidinus]
MKPLKAAAVLAGSLVVAGAAAPAFAADASSPVPAGLGGALETLTSQRNLDVRHFQHQSDALSTENKQSVLHTVNTATARLNQQGTGRLLGGLPLQGR